MLTINELLVRDFSTSINHLQVTVKRNVVFGYLLYLGVSCVGDVMSVLFCTVFSLSAFVCHIFCFSFV